MFLLSTSNFEFPRTWLARIRGSECKLFAGAEFIDLLGVGALLVFYPKRFGFVPDNILGVKGI